MARLPPKGILDYDQAHFARDFRMVVGVPPDSHRERVQASRVGAALPWEPTS